MSFLVSWPLEKGSRAGWSLETGVMLETQVPLTSRWYDKTKPRPLDFVDTIKTKSVPNDFVDMIKNKVKVHWLLLTDDQKNKVMPTDFVTDWKQKSSSHSADTTIVTSISTREFVSRRTDDVVRWGFARSG
jgi:hypothetical protein